jgi:hypothetical protein
MFDKMFGKMLDKEQITRETIQDTLQDLVIELDCNPWELAISIEPLKEVKIQDANGGESIDRENKSCRFVCYVYQFKMNEKGEYKRRKVREITLKEILTGENG